MLKFSALLSLPGPKLRAGLYVFKFKLSKTIKNRLKQNSYHCSSYFLRIFNPRLIIIMNLVLNKKQHKYTKAKFPATQQQRFRITKFFLNFSSRNILMSITAACPLEVRNGEGAQLSRESTTGQPVLSNPLARPGTNLTPARSTKVEVNTGIQAASIYAHC